MNPDRLLERLPATLGRKHAEQADALAHELGMQLCSDYKERALRFKQIALCTKTRITTDGVISTPRINLGLYTHPKVGQVHMSAQLRIQDYNPSQHLPYNVTTYFSGQADDEIVDLGRETFGSTRFDFTADHTPTFVRNPYTRCTDPWDIGEGVIFRYPLSHSWTMKTYTHLLDELSPMMAAAAETQDMLIAALQDPALNPASAEAAARLTLPGSPSVII